MSSTNRTMVYLCSPSKKKICVLNGIDDSSGGIGCNGTDFNSLTFDVYKQITIDGEFVESNGYSYIKSKMYLLLQNSNKGNGYYRLTTEPTKSNDGNIEKLTVSAISAESELVDKNLVGVKINTGEVDSYENLDKSNIGVNKLPKEYVTFYNPTNKKLSLLHIITSKAVGWSIGYVDPALTTITTNPTRNPKYSFSIDNEDIYSFLINTLSKSARCVFDFDIENFTINAYAIENIGEDTGVVVSLRNLANSIKVSCNDDSIYTCFRVAGGEGIDGIEAVNIGQGYIEDLSYYTQYPFMEEPLITKYNTWVSYREGRRADYVATMKSFTEANSKANEILNRVPDDVLEKTMWNGFTAYELQDQLAFYNALKGIVEKDPAYQTGGVFDIEKLKLVPLYYTYECYQPIIENIKVAFGNRLKISTDTELNTFLTKFATEKNEILTEFTVGGIVNMNALNASDKKYAYNSLIFCIPLVEYYIANYSTISDENPDDYPNDWETDWKLFGVSELTAKLQLYDHSLGMLRKTLDVTYLTNAYTYSTLPDAEKAKYTNEENYNKKKVEYQDALSLYSNCSSALAERKSEYDLQMTHVNYISSGLETIVTDVEITNSKHGFSIEELATLDKLRNYNDHTNENVISTNLDTLVDDIDSKNFLYNDAKEQLYIKSHPQFTWEAEVDNLFALEEFKSWHSDFSLWNFINLAVSDTYMEKLRIISLEFNPFDKHSNDLTVTFSNSIRTNQGVSDFTTILGGIASANKNSITSGSSSNSSSTNSQMINSLIQLLNYNSTVKSTINDVANKVTTESQIESSKELNKTRLITDKIYGTVLDWAYEGTLDGKVEIDGGLLHAHSVVADKLATNAIMSLYYEPPSSGYFSGRGTYLNLEDGSITSKNFSIDGSGNARFKGIVEASGGNIGGFKIEGDNLIRKYIQALAIWETEIRTNYFTQSFYSYFGSGEEVLEGKSQLSWDELCIEGRDSNGNYVLYSKMREDLFEVGDENYHSSLTRYGLSIEDGEEYLLNINANTINTSISGQTSTLFLNPYSTTSISKLKVTDNAQFRGNGLDLYYTTPYIDFHFDNNASDYTSRIVEEASGELSFLVNPYTGGAKFTGAIMPYTDSGSSCGKSSMRWSSAYLSSSPIVTSDKDKKTPVSNFTKQHEDFFMLLTGKVYKFVDGTSGRSHWGWYAQDIEQAMTDVGLTDLDFAGFCKDTIINENTGEETILYSLRYEEFISLTVHMAQNALNKIILLENRLEVLELTDVKSQLTDIKSQLEQNKNI